MFNFISNSFPPTYISTCAPRQDHLWNNEEAQNVLSVFIKFKQSKKADPKNIFILLTFQFQNKLVSIHPFFSIYMWSGCGGNTTGREAHMSNISTVTLCSSAGEIPNCSHGREDLLSFQWFLVLPQGLLPAGRVLFTHWRNSSLWGMELFSLSLRLSWLRELLVMVRHKPFKNLCKKLYSTGRLSDSTIATPSTQLCLQFMSGYQLNAIAVLAAWWLSG